MFFKRKKRENKPVPDTKEAIDKCLCTECPSNPDQTVLYCSRGLTKKPIEQVRALGCSCAFCPVFHEYRLSGCYLCLNKSSYTSQTQPLTHSFFTSQTQRAEIIRCAGALELEIKGEINDVFRERQYHYPNQSPSAQNILQLHGINWFL